MYLKAFLLLSATFLINGCVSEKELTPSSPNANLGQVSNNVVTPLDSNVTIEETDREFTEHKRPKYLKPEPYSLESNQDDPELLGPQTTLSRPLQREEESDGNKTVAN